MTNKTVQIRGYGFGTSDATLINNDILHVVDFKYGKGIEVAADHNPQMMIYAIGAYQNLNLLYPDIKTVRMTIYQPRIGNIDTWETDIVNLKNWFADTLLIGTRRVENDTGKFLAGKHCQFCLAKIRCKAYAERMINVIPEGGTVKPELLDNDQLSKILAMADELKKWADSIKGYCLDEALKGTKFYGFKLVEGRSSRIITDTDKVISILTEKGVKDFMTKPQLESLTTLEKLVGKKQLSEMISAYIEKPEGKPSLVPLSNKKPALDTAVKDFKQFEDR